MWTGAAVKALRLRYGERQEDFCRRFRITIACLQNWEQGRVPVPGMATVLLDQLEAGLQDFLIKKSAEAD